MPLPAQPNRLIGRDQELSDLLSLMALPEVRLITVTGPAGAGKTRLAVAAAAQQSDEVWFVDLAPIHDSRLVVTTIGRAAGVREQPGEMAEGGLDRYIADRRILVLLDNFEQVVASAGELARLLAACPNLRLLVTSRAPLRLRWEHIFSVAPLDQASAVALFVERARAVDHGFQMTDANAAAVAAICRRLDGLPLAIELAAARSDVYAPAEVLRRLQRRFERLAGGVVDLPPRQQSLEAAFDWSYELLKPSDQALFRALSVCVGGFTPAAALAVAGSDDLAALAQHSLVRRDQKDETRFRMLETVRAYAFERLDRAGEGQGALDRHARFMLELAERAAPELTGPHQMTWLERLEREHDNLAVAMRWTMDASEVELSLRLARALWRFWWLHGHLSEGMATIDSVLSLSGGPEPIRAAVLNGGGVLAHVRGEYDRADRLISESLVLSRRLGLESTTAAALHNLGALARERANWPRAREAYEESLSLERELGNTWGIATSLINLGALAADQADLAHARALLDESLTQFQKIGDTRGVASALHNLASIARDAADWTAAAALDEQSLALWRKLSDGWGTAAALVDLARVVARSGDWRRAAGLLSEALSIFGELGVRQGMAACLEGLAEVLCEAHQPVDGARLLGAAEALREQIGLPLSLRDRRDLLGTIGRVRRAAPSAAFRAAWANGRLLSPDAAALEASRLAASVAAEPGSPSSSAGLTPREREVVELIVEGLSNRQIAQRLVISERTADRHVSNILARLGLNSRTQVATWAAQKGRTS